MNKFIILFIYLISTSLCGYLPLKKGNGFDDNVCAYKYSSVSYVKTCKDKGKYCKDIDEETSFCENVPTKISLKTLDDSCISKYECDKGLDCFGKCRIFDPALLSTICPTNQEPHKTQTGWSCKDTAIADYCYYKDNTAAYSSGVTYIPDYSKVCGEIDFKQNSLGTLGTKYEVLTVKSAYIGTVPDGKFVLNPLACKSGYALPFYPNSKDVDPSSDSSNRNYMFLQCVTLNDIDYEDYNKCILKYDTDKLYDASKVINSNALFKQNYLDYSITTVDCTINDQFCNKNLITKLDMFSKYIGIYTEDKQKNCAIKDNYNEPYTCNDNELRKWFYYYNNPEHYILYYNEDGNDIANYLIQQEFPLYESSKFIYIKYFINFLFILLFF
jgi:hypothetical protein